MDLPKKYKHQEAEQKWRDYWEALNVYKYDPTATRENTFSIDTPPPTVSGSLHIGHVFSYTQTDVLARFHRMNGKSIFYPMGWDDNGLPTERRVQNVYAIKCNPQVPYSPDWKPEKATQKSKTIEVSRQNFIQACNILTKEDEQAFEHMWRKLALSVDWDLQYATINDHCRKISQKSFLDCHQKGWVYNHEAPTMWDTQYETAVAQAEVEDRERPGAYHDIEFAVEGGGSFTISTTRPELLAACIAVVAHPEDERFKPLFGKHAITPLFHAKVPICPAEHADPEKGTGILMVCTFGDIMDVEWWKQSQLPVKQIISPKGTLLPITFGEGPFTSEDTTKAQENYDTLQGLSIKKAQAQIVELLKQPGSSITGENTALVKEPEAITHPVKFYEKGDMPLEFITTRQWFIRILDHKQDLIKQGDAIDWHPSFMKSRYTNWVEGLNQDWCISRQRYFGVPFPVWYRLDANTMPDYDNPIFASPEQCPVDPTIDTPEGYTEAQRNQPNGFAADPDVMDTWATSSLTPQLMSGWSENETQHNNVFPMDVRPQSHEIIRTWAFYTITKAWMHEKKVPWNNVAISGWVLDPDRKKMSKSKGNVVTPENLLDDYSSDAVRYWASKAKLGADTAFDESVFTIGKKLVTKLFNASKFTLMQLQDAPEDLNETHITTPIDQSFVAQLNEVIAQATKSFSSYDYATALEKTETLFWTFCDHYIELVKGRAYREEDTTKRYSAMATLDWSLKTFLRLFAPFLPYITEEIWSYRYNSSQPTIHKAPWPTTTEVVLSNTDQSDPIFDLSVEVLSQIRGAKTTAQKNMKHPVESLTIQTTQNNIQHLTQAQEDLVRAGTITSITFKEEDNLNPKCEVVLGEVTDKA